MSFSLHSMMPLLVWALFGLPLLGLLGIGVLRLLRQTPSDAAEKRLVFWVQLVVLLSLTCLGLLDVAVWQSSLSGGLPGLVSLADWFQSGEIQLKLNAQIDPIALTLLHVVSFITVVIVRFSVNYLHREPGFDRFYAVLMLFFFGMQLLALAGNAALAFIAWEVLGVSSYLLIIYNPSRHRSSQNASRAWVTNRVGDAGFLLAIFLLFQWLSNSDWQTLAVQARHLDSTQRDLIALAFLLPALIKSAQFPFCAWITRALEGPTPSSAIFYGSVMVHAGVVLLLRIQPLLAHTPAVLVLIGLIGFLSIIYAYFVGLTQSDVKSALIFPTIAQVGWMLIWISLGWTTLALTHLASHAVFRAWQFLNAPALMHQVTRPARPVAQWMQNSRFWYTAALQRFWLDPLSHWLIEQPTQKLAQDIHRFDRRILARWVANPVSPEASANKGIGQGSGLFGSSMQWFAERFEWFEQRLVLQSSGAGLTQLMQQMGSLFSQAEALLKQPRYLAAMLLLVFIVSV